MPGEIALAGIIVALLLLDFIIKENKAVIGWTFTVLMAALMVYVAAFKTEATLLNGAYVSDGLSWISQVMILLAASLTGLLSVQSVKTGKKFTGAYYILLACSTLGLMFLVSSKELITLYIGLELATVSLYALAAIYKTDDSSTEAAIKYLIL